MVSCGAAVEQSPCFTVGLHITAQEGVQGVETVSRLRLDQGLQGRQSGAQIAARGG